jgi:hypothetical protein
MIAAISRRELDPYSAVETILAAHLLRVDLPESD